MMPGSISPPLRDSSSKWPGFMVNRSGFPFDDLTWNELWEFASHLYPEATHLFQEIRSSSHLEDPPAIVAPPNVHSFFHSQHRSSPGARSRSGGRIQPQMMGPSFAVRVQMYITRVQEYMNRLSYNHTGTQFFEIRPNSSLISHSESARSIIREALPIKCMEALILGVYLTNGVQGLGRFSINFKSDLCGPQPNSSSTSQRRRYYYHVVLGLSLGNRFGSIGLSRRRNLMDKPLTSNCLSDLLRKFIECYGQCGQRLQKIRIGKLIPHDQHSISTITWKAITLQPRIEAENVLAARVDKFSRELIQRRI